MMDLSQKIRRKILAVNLALALLTLGKVVLDPTIGKSPNLAFPLKVSLPGWKLLESKAISPKHPDSLVSHYYQFIQKNYLLDIEMRYLINTDGDVAKYIQKYTPINREGDVATPGLRQRPSLSLHQQEAVGFYSMFVRQDRAYLSACINPRGGATVSSQQFSQNRYTYDLDLKRLLRWFVSRVDIWEDHCLWSHLSIEIEDNSLEATYSILERAWISWYKQWRLPLPNS